VCPFPCHSHGPSPNPEQFKINFKDGLWLWHCFGDCQRGGDVVEFVKMMTGYDNSHVRFWFAEKFGDRLTVKKATDRKDNQASSGNGSGQKPTTGPPAVVKAAEETVEQEKAADSELKPLRFHLRLDPNVAYLKDRGLLDETIEYYGLGLCTKGVLKGYVAIPIYTPQQAAGENPVAYLGRWPGEDWDDGNGRPRYRWPEGFPKSRIVYGLREALTTPDSTPLVVVEGAFKVYHLVQAGFTSAVAIMGSSLSEEQASILAETNRAIVLLFDGDEAGRMGMRLAAAKLIRTAFVRVVSLPDGAEPDELPPASLEEALSFVHP
jgi:DNA primase